MSTSPADVLPTLTRSGRLPLGELTATEWVLTDGLGGFAMGTASGIPTRRYHGLLVASITPPVRREVLWHSVVDRLVVSLAGGGERVLELSAFRFVDGTVHPRGFEHLDRFEREGCCRWVFRSGAVEVVRTLRLAREGASASVSYEVRGLEGMGRLEVRPLVAMRDAHELHREDRMREEMSASASARSVRVGRGDRALLLSAERGFFEPSEQWWRGFRYEAESARGLDDVEDLYSPGVFMLQLRGGADGGEAGTAGMSVTGSLAEPVPELATGARGSAWAAELERSHRKRLASQAGVVLGRLRAGTPEADRRAIAALVGAADAFVVRRGTAARPGVSIIAGYPWFSDWGRDSMISMQGLLLTTGRVEEARLLLETFASHMRDGLVPNLFDDSTGEALYNTVDASLWYLHAAWTLARSCGGVGAIGGTGGAIASACAAIVEAYRRGTGGEAHGVRFRIAMDPADGLVSAGDEASQLTWMDARRDGVVFTPRHGKAVEINALWHHGLVCVAELFEGADAGRAGELRELAGRVASSFRARFWNPVTGGCVDVLTPGVGGSWRADPRIRPNMVLAASLRHTPMTAEQRAGVVATARAHLLTPMGLRTLSPAEPGYRGRFEGPIFERDAAYHNGTVWPWLMGAFVEASLRAGGFDEESRALAREDLRPLVERLSSGPSLGQLEEVFDGDDSAERPRLAGGCVAQAWSVAEVLRAMVMVHSEA